MGRALSLLCLATALLSGQSSNGPVVGPPAPPPAWLDKFQEFQDNEAAWFDNAKSVEDLIKLASVDPKKAHDAIEAMKAARKKADEAAQNLHSQMKADVKKQSDKLKAAPPGTDPAQLQTSLTQVGDFFALNAKELDARISELSKKPAENSALLVILKDQRDKALAAKAENDAFAAKLASASRGRDESATVVETLLHVDTAFDEQAQADQVSAGKWQEFLDSISSQMDNLRGARANPALSFLGDWGGGVYTCNPPKIETWNVRIPGISVRAPTSPTDHIVRLSLTEKQDEPGVVHAVLSVDPPKGAKGTPTSAQFDINSAETKDAQKEPGWHGNMFSYPKLLSNSNKWWLDVELTSPQRLAVSFTTVTNVLATYCEVSLDKAR